MNDRRGFFWFKNDEERQIYKQAHKKDKQGYVHATVFSTLFSKMNTALVGTNTMYEELRSDIKPCVDDISTKEKLKIDIVETVESSEFARESTIIGFRKYMKGKIYAQKKAIVQHFALFFSIAILGILIELILYKFIAPNYPDAGVNWGFKSVEVLATLFIWQFGGYIAFEFLGEIKSYKKNKQISKAEFTFKFFD